MIFTGRCVSQMDRYANEKLYPEEWTLDGLIQEAEDMDQEFRTFSFETLC